MEKDIMQEVAFLFVEQYEKLVEPYKDSEVALIRATAEKGETAMYMVVASIFGPSLDQALLGAPTAVWTILPITMKPGTKWMSGRR